jgi:putative acetyltransferase
MLEEPLTIRQDDPTAPYVADLLALHLAELRNFMPEFAFALDASGLSAPDVTFWTAWRGAELAGFAALKQLESRHGEVKSMRAAPSARRSGVGRALLNHVVGVAKARGYARLSLETGTTEQYIPAIALYQSLGFAPCEAFSDYQPSPFNQFFALDLAV